jgi:RNA polymerase sigma-70 factor (ECF subfamily)
LVPTDLQTLSDQAVVLLVRDGREDGARELVRRYERPVFSLVLRLVGDRALAEDLSQETFIRTLTHIDSYRTELKFSSWIFRIAHNAAIDHLRRRHPETLSLDGDPNADGVEEAAAGAIAVADQAASPLDQLVTAELGMQLEGAIAQLRPAYRTCVTLRYVEDLSYEEIAQTLDLPIGTVKTHLHRARLELQALLGPVRTGDG